MLHRLVFLNLNFLFLFIWTHLDLSSASVSVSVGKAGTGTVLATSSGKIDKSVPQTRTPHFYNDIINGIDVRVESFKPQDKQSNFPIGPESLRSADLHSLNLEGSEPLKDNNVFQDELVTTIVNGEFNVTYSKFKVNRTSQLLFIYSYNETNQTTAVRISVTCTEADRHFPVMFVARQQEGILSWRVPLELGDAYQYLSVSRTLCPLDQSHRRHSAEHQFIYLGVSTMSLTNMGFNVTARHLQDFEIIHRERKTFSVSASSPKYFMYSFPDDVETVLLSVKSASDVCMTVSVQSVKCPVFDLDTNVEFEGKHQTMTTQAAMFIQKSDYDKTGTFYVVFVVKPDNTSCTGKSMVSILPSRLTEIWKEVHVEIKATISSSQYYKATFAAVGTFFAFYVVAFIIGCVFAGCGLHKGLDELTDAERELLRNAHTNQCEMPDVLCDEEDRYLNRGRTPDHSYGATADARAPPASPRELGSLLPRRGSVDSSTSAVDEAGIDFLPDADVEKEVVRTKTALFVSDLSRKKRTRLAKMYKLYHWNLLTIAIFYGLPVAQLVITYQRMLTETGDEDLCYYNFACAHPLQSYLSSFNNVFSNIGYILLGLLFILIVYRRNVLYKRLIQKHGELEKQYGIPQHFGLFYAMGLALVMEGIMSGCYHVCPNYSNFQFDTSFMYIIACLCMLKIYQTRHPDINAKAHTAYFVIAVIIFIAVFGVVYGTPALWILYALAHIFLSFVLTAQIYYMGRWTIDRYIFKRVFLVVISDFRRCSRPVYPNRFVMLFIGNMINWAFALYGAIERPADFASYLLAIFIGNLLLYCIFYMSMKILSKERINWLVTFVILTSMVTWGGALYFFFQHLTSWSKTPAGSRAGNKECILLEFYDHHDVWHFLSAISLFFSFLILFLLDDDLSLTRRDRIPVF